MKPFGTHNYYVYIITNFVKTVLYIGVCNDIKRRLYEHECNAKSGNDTFAAKYNCFYLLYIERFQYVEHAIAREKQIKKYSRRKKEDLINSHNPEWRFMNNDFD